MVRIGPVTGVRRRTEGWKPALGRLMRPVAAATEGKSRG